MADDISTLRTSRDAREAVFAIHYACQNFNEVKDSPPAVTCVSFYDVNLRSATGFSLANMGGTSVSVQERESLLLKSTFKFLRDHSEARWLHWKMNRPEYGFQALADRAAWLDNDVPAIPPSDRRHDLDLLISERYGRNYAPHPRLPSLIHLNALGSRYARWGAEEADLANRGEYAAVQQSVTEKVRLLTDIFGLLVEGRLQTENSAGEIQFGGGRLDAVTVILAIADRFILVRRALLRRHAGRETLKIADEYDAQDLVRALLLQFFDDVRDEEWTPSYAGAASRIDFILPQTRLAVELKWTRQSMSQRDLGEQLIVDREKYKTHPGVSHLVCLVFDYEGFLPNPRGIENDLAQPGADEAIACTVKIIDR